MTLPLLSFHQASIMNGILYKWTNNIFRWQCRYFIIDEDECRMTYYTSKKNQESGIYKDFIDLKNAQLVLLDGSQFYIRNKNKKFRLKAKNKNERYLWINALRRTYTNDPINMTSRSLKDSNAWSVSDERIWCSKPESIESLTSFNERGYHMEELERNSIYNFKFDDDFNTDFINGKYNKYPTLNEVAELENPCSAISDSEDYYSLTSCPHCKEDTNEANGNVIEDNSNEYFDELYDYDQNDLEVKADASIILHLLGQLKIGMDLSKISLPVHILERRSTLEMYGDFLAHADLWLEIEKVQTEEGRMLACLKWYLSAFHTNQKSEIAKKSYNPVLGEVFKCKFEVPNLYPNCPDESVSFYSEQVSHHPPISAFFAENETKSFQITGHINPKSRFAGLYVSVEPIGKVKLKLIEKDEEYFITFPTAYCNSIFTSPWIEIGGKSIIYCPKTGYKSVIHFKTKGLFGKKDKLEASVFRPNEKEPFFFVEGNWKNLMKGKFISDRDFHTFLDIGNLRQMRKRVTERSKQLPYESRKLWEDVTKHLKENNVQEATEAKYLIEELQRQEAKERAMKNVSWEMRKFVKTCDGYEYVGDK